MFVLKNHPFAVQAFFKSSLVLTFAVPKNELENLIPECLELDTFNENLAFVAAAFVQTKNLRPKGFPTFLGTDFFLTGYRIFVRYTNKKGKRLRGLYILKSETNKKRMTFLGNIFTHYKYTTTDIRFHHSSEKITILSKKSDLDLEIRLKNSSISLPENSPFKDWKEARRYAGPLPFTFTYNDTTKEILIIEGLRTNWIPKPVEVIKNKIGFINQKVFKGAILANAFIIERIPYLWKKGEIEVWEK